MDNKALIFRDAVYRSGHIVFFCTWREEKPISSTTKKKKLLIITKDSVSLMELNRRVFKYHPKLLRKTNPCWYFMLRSSVHDMVNVYTATEAETGFGTTERKIHNRKNDACSGVNRWRAEVYFWSFSCFHQGVSTAGLLHVICRKSQIDAIRG